MAINFPSTVGQPTDGSFTHIESGVGYKWDGESWNAIGANLTPLTDLAAFSVTTNAAGSPALSYNINSGVFSYTPPDLSGFAANTNVANWDNAYSWGDHSLSGYATQTFVNTALTNLNNWDTAYGWGDHSAAGYLTAESQTLDDVLALGATTARDISTTGTILYANVFSTIGALPNATTYHGMFAHVHSEGHGYFAHAGSWTQLLDTGSSIGEIGDVDLSTAPTDNQVLKWDNANSKWIPGSISSAGGAVTLTDFSVATNAVGTAALSYDNTSGVFTYTPPDVPAALSNIVDSGQGVNVTGKVATTDGMDIDIGGSINAAGTSIDFQNTTISFSGATIGGLSGTIHDAVDFHLNQSTATDGQILSWNATGGGAGTGDYEWIAAGSSSVTIADDDGTKTNSIKIGSDDDLVLSYDGTVGVQVSFIESDALIIRTKTTPNENYITFLKDGPVELFYDDSKKLSTSAQGISVVGTVTDNKGELRNLPINEKTTDYTLVTEDYGKAVFFSANSGTITIPNGVFSPGHLITIINDTGTTQTIVQGTGLTMYYTADGTTGNRQSSQRSSTTILFKDTSIAYISGTGLT